MTESRIFDLTNPEDGAGAPYSDFKKKRREHPQRQDCALPLSQRRARFTRTRERPRKRGSICFRRCGNQMAARLERRDALVLVLSTRQLLVPGEMTEDLRVRWRQQTKMSATGEQLWGGPSRKSRSEARSGSGRSSWRSEYRSRRKSRINLRANG